MAPGLAPGSTFAGYRIHRLVGEGGMGAVYRASEPGSERPVALKVVRSEFAHDLLFRARFDRECRLMSELAHPHVVPLYRAGEADGDLYVATAFIEGTDLEAVIAGQGPVHPRHAADVVAQVASALDAAHERGVVHRDVKPANILLEDQDGAVHAYLADFGLSKHMSSQSGLTKTGVWVGTIDYAAPEQLEAQTVDTHADIYALGCVLYEALTGKVPFPRARDVDKILAHLSEPPPPVGEVAPPAFDEVIARAMAKRPEDRYSMAGDLGRAALAAAEAAGPAPTASLIPSVPKPVTPVDRGAPTAG